MRTRTWSRTSGTIKTAWKELHESTERETSGYVFCLFDGYKNLALKFYFKKYAAFKLY